MNKWFLIYCKPMQDSRAEENLLRQGYEVFRPMVSKKISKIGCQNSFRQESLFPRYIFIFVDPQVKSLAPVMSTFGVVSFVKFGDHYATASENLINQIKISEQSAASMSDDMRIKNGDEIYIDGHGFDQVKAIYCNPCGDERSVILMNILGKESRLTVPNKCLSYR